MHTCIDNEIYFTHTHTQIYSKLEKIFEQLLKTDSILNKKKKESTNKIKINQFISQPQIQKWFFFKQ